MMKPGQKVRLRVGTVLEEVIFVGIPSQPSRAFPAMTAEPVNPRQHYIPPGPSAYIKRAPNARQELVLMADLVELVPG